MSGRRVKFLRKYLNTHYIELSLFFGISTKTDNNARNKIFRKLKNYYHRYKTYPKLVG